MKSKKNPNEKEDEGRSRLSFHRRDTWLIYTYILTNTLNQYKGNNFPFFSFLFSLFFFTFPLTK